MDFKGEAITFKATSEGVLATLQHCVELMAQREDAWRRRWEREVDKKRKLQELHKALKDQVAMHHNGSPRPRVVIHGGPDYEVGSFFPWSRCWVYFRFFYVCIYCSRKWLFSDGFPTVSCYNSFTFSLRNHKIAPKSKYFFLKLKNTK